jgi:hypothetical protein
MSESNDDKQKNKSIANINNEEFEQLTNNIQKDKKIDKLNFLVTQRNFAIIIIILVIMIQFFIIGSQCNQSKIMKRQSKLQYLSSYKIEQKIMREGRKRNAMQMIMKIALYYQPNINEKLLARAAEMIYDVGECIYDIPVEEWILLYSLEGQWDKNAKSYANARGPGQLMYCIGELVASELGIKWRGVETLYNYMDNIRLSMRWYYKLKSRYIEPRYYLTAYNWGEDDIGQFCSRDKKGDFIRRKKITGKYRKYFYKDYVRTKKRVEKVLGVKFFIEGLDN